MFDKIIKNLFDDIIELLKDENLVVFKRIVIIAINLSIFISPSFLFMYLYNFDIVENNRDIKTIILCLIYSSILFVIGYYAEAFKGIYCSSNNMEIEIRNKKTLENIIGSIKNMGIISIVLLVVHGIIRLIDYRTALDIKIGLIIILVIMSLQVLRSICNYFKIKREIQIREDERNKFKNLLEKLGKNREDK